MSSTATTTTTTTTVQPLRWSAVDLLQGLLSVPSLSGGEAAAVAWFTAALEELGYRAWTDGAGNACGSVGSSHPDAPEILLLGHIDTVPGEIAVRVQDGILHGRGAVDAKGPLVAFAIAAARAATDGSLPDGVRVTVIGAVGEETWGSPGASWLCAHYPTPAAVVIGEPSGWDAMVLGYKGSTFLTASVGTDLSHSAGPEATAPELAFAFWQRVQVWLATHNAGADAPGYATLDGTLRGFSSSGDGLRETATLQASFRLPPGITTTDVASGVAELALQDNVQLTWQPNAEAFRVDKRSPLVAPFMAGIRAAGGQPRIKVKTGTADMNLVGPAWGCPIIAYGPGDAAFDHRPDEQISVAELDSGVDVLHSALPRIAQHLLRQREQVQVTGEGSRA